MTRGGHYPRFYVFRVTGKCIYSKDASGQERLSMAESRWEQIVRETREPRERAAVAFGRHLEGLMEERGIDGLEDLYRCFVEVENGDVSVLGLHRDKAVSYDLFERLITGKIPSWYAEIGNGLREVLELTEDEYLDLLMIYMFGEPLSAEPRNA
jgi:hypothetical protein